MPIAGQPVSAPASGGNATLTSSGMPSHDVIAPLQNRWPPAWTEQFSAVAVFVKTCGIAASADGVAIRPAATAASASFLRIAPLPLRDSAITPRASTVAQLCDDLRRHP